MRKLLLTAFAVGMGAIAMTNVAHAYSVTVYTGNTSGKAFNAAPTTPTTGSIMATFDYSGPLSFNVSPPQNSTSTGDLNSVFFSNGSVSNYVGSGSLSSPANADFTNLSTFLASSGSASNLAYGSLLIFDLGTIAAGTTLTITHDDGATVYQNGSQVGTTYAGPTSAITETVTLTQTADTLLYYSRQNGAPSVLSVTVPEPTSIALVASALFGVAVVRRRKA